MNKTFFILAAVTYVTVVVTFLSVLGFNRKSGATDAKKRTRAKPENEKQLDGSDTAPHP